MCIFTFRFTSKWEGISLPHHEGRTQTEDIEEQGDKKFWPKTDEIINKLGKLDN
jgi:hypothetical protein